MREDLTGKHFGNLEVISYNENTKKWICKCKCGNSTEVSGSNLRLGNTKSCGCSRNATGIKRHKKVNVKGEHIGQLYVKDINMDKNTAEVKCMQCKRDLTMSINELINLKKTRKKSITCGINGCRYNNGRNRNSEIKEDTRFGKLVVKKRLDNKIVKTERSETSIPMYLCKCDCGNEVEVQGRYLLDGRTKSCGCLRQKNFSDKTSNNDFLISSIVGKSLYKIFLNWQQKYRQPTKLFKEKVIDKNIKFFPELKKSNNSFKEFYNWSVSHNFSIKDKRIYLDRKDYDKDFNEDNCFWTEKRTKGY